MAPPPTRAALAVLAAVLLVACSAAALQMPGQAAACAGTAAECPAAAGGGGGRELWGENYIGYDALRRGAVPCSQRGASYYNCRPGGEANPYSRGCSSITQCRG